MQMVKKVLFFLITLLTFCALVKLGWWQLQRAEEKRELLSRMVDNGRIALRWDQVTGDEALGGRHLSLVGRLRPEHSLLLDNRIQSGRVGYQWLLPVEVTEDQPWLLLDLGFVAAPENRAELPVLPAVPSQARLSGRLYRPGHNPLANQLRPEPGPVTRIQAVNFPQLSAWLGRPLQPWLLFVQQPAELGFERHWRPVTLSPERHRGYALQWFGLALAWAVVAALIWRGPVATAHEPK
ncbi:SURF1 family protein [Ferrimonas sediminicola]|uniref:SURF1-like protein n=1 Tax=Ferrimonas sediminicola TaxID=2569538 RepID=A0A4U1BAP7_9GAMM|nr:SURF1 family protein [Ferrimonas sediminicola]TKB47618.1 SURF1 family protein [Ferrimonas sediminicola]